jgi:hypothetical protein
VDLLEAKSRIAEALVESIFRRALYGIAPHRREGAGSALRVGRDDLSPDFRVRMDDAEGTREFPVHVRYHPQIDQFLAMETQRGERSVLRLALRHWPDLHFVMVSERPEGGRSCFQAVRLPAYHAGGGAYRSQDLAAVENLAIFAHNVADHEELLRRIFAHLSGT